MIKQTETKIFTQIREYSAGIKTNNSNYKKTEEKTTTQWGKLSKSQSYIGNILPTAQNWYSTTFTKGKIQT